MILIETNYGKIKKFRSEKNALKFLKKMARLHSKMSDYYRKRGEKDFNEFPKLSVMIKHI